MRVSAEAVAVNVYRSATARDDTEGALFKETGGHCENLDHNDA